WRIDDEAEALTSCWACGAGDFAETSLERAHIVAVSLGGDSTPSNFLLLCGLCHRDQPDGASREVQLMWLYAHESDIDRFMRNHWPSIERLRLETEGYPP